MSLYSNRVEPDGLRHALTYQPALDGVRAMAVLLVILYHGGVRGFHGGYIGVDVFFGLSGFLISTLLLREFDGTHGIHVLRFWIRRFKRLMPALLTVVAVSTIAAAIVFPMGYYPNLVHDALSAIFYVSNWNLIGSHTYYFNSLTAPSILTQTWSLAIEEQFYLIWPIIILLLMRIRQSPIVVTIVATVGALVSTLLMNEGYHGAESATRLYFQTHTHIQGLMLGAAAAGLLEYGRRRCFVPSQRFGNAVQLTGALGVVATLFIAYQAYGDSEFMFRWGFLAVAFAVAIMVASLSLQPRSALARLFGVTPLARIGRMSYGLYLWHYPVFAVLNHFHTGLSSWWLLSVRLIASIAIAALSYYYLELPIRRRDWHRSLVAAVASIAAMALVASVCILVGRGVETSMVYKYFGPPELHNPVTAVVIGDSQIFTFSVVSYRQSSKANVRIFSAAQLGCGLVASTQIVTVNSRNWTTSPCRMHRDGTWPLQSTWRNIIRSVKPNVVVVAAGRWEAYDQMIGPWLNNITQVGFQERIRWSLQTLYLESRDAGATMLLATAPCNYSGETPAGDYFAQDRLQRVQIYNRLVTKFAEERKLPVFDFYRTFCPNGKFSYYQDGRQVRNADGIHYTWDAGLLDGTRFWNKVREVGLENQSTRGAK